MVSRIVLAAALASVALPAYAVERPWPSKADSRIWYANYAPNNVIRLVSAPGSTLLLKLADDEKIITVKGADTDQLKGSWHGANFEALKFDGCMIPQPLIVLTHKADGEDRSYVFSVETVPITCDKTLTKQAPLPVPSTTGLIPAADAAELPPVDQAPPDIRHLEHIDDLAPASASGHGGHIPYEVQILYPSDAAAKRRAAAVAAHARREARETHDLMRVDLNGYTSQPYRGIGDASLKPAAAGDDGNTTTLIFPVNQHIPPIYRLGNPGVLCGQDGSDEHIVDPAVHGDRVTIGGTAQAWCLRSGTKVYELWNPSYTVRGWSPGTGTDSVHVERVVNGAGR